MSRHLSLPVATPVDPATSSLIAHLQAIAAAPLHATTALLLPLARFAGGISASGLGLVCSEIAGRLVSLAASVHPLPGRVLVVLCSDTLAERAEHELCGIVEILAMPDDTGVDAPGRDIIVRFDVTTAAGRAALVNAITSEGSRVAQGCTRRPLDTAEVARLCNDLRLRDVAEFLACQPVLLLRSARDIQVLFREYFVSIEALQRRLAPEVDLLAHAGLFRFFSEQLDQWVLRALADRPELLESGGAISLNLNLSSLRTEAFRRFYGGIGRDRQLLVEVRLPDLWSGSVAVTELGEELRREGLGLVLDGIDARHLTVLDASRIAADFIKIVWPPSVDPMAAAPSPDGLPPVIQRIGGERVILSRVGSEAAASLATACGIRRLQGHFVDQIAAALAASAPHDPARNGEGR